MIARVFPRRTKATPTDDLAFVGIPDLMVKTMEIEEVHISIAFTWDVASAWLDYRVWEAMLPGDRMGAPGDYRAEDQGEAAK